ncbi:hypothetical protein B0H13DRAFT_2348358 [Mycena leptocephala]|nr:hypothetical protein B0H13DRAFT_2348358 [Mycena leptocephala]
MRGISGAATGTWIFQVTGTFTVETNKKDGVQGGGFAQNIWVVTGAVSINAGTHLEGVLLWKRSIALLTGATANSRLLAQTVVTLQKVRTSTVTIKLQIDVYSAL